MRASTQRGQQRGSGAARRGVSAVQSAKLLPERCVQAQLQAQPSCMARVNHGTRSSLNPRGPAPCAAATSGSGSSQTIAVTGASTGRGVLVPARSRRSCWLSPFATQGQRTSSSNKLQRRLTTLSAMTYLDVMRLCVHSPALLFNVARRLFCASTCTASLPRNLHTALHPRIIAPKAACR